VKGATELYRLALETDPRTTTAIHALKRLCFAEDRFADLVTVLAREGRSRGGSRRRERLLLPRGALQSDRLGAPEAGGRKLRKSGGRGARRSRRARGARALYELGKQWGELSTVLERLARLSPRPAEQVGYYHRMGRSPEERLASDESADRLVRKGARRSTPCTCRPSRRS
jgi:hypothetical protein